MTKLAFFIALTSVSTSALAADFQKDFHFNSRANIEHFKANSVEKIDQLNRNIVEFTNPTLNGYPLNFVGDQFAIKREFCKLLGFSEVDGIGGGSGPTVAEIVIGSNGELGSDYRDLAVTDMFRCGTK